LAGKNTIFLTPFQSFMGLKSSLFFVLLDHGIENGLQYGQQYTEQHRYPDAIHAKTVNKVAGQLYDYGIDYE